MLFIYLFENLHYFIFLIIYNGFKTIFLTFFEYTVYTEKRQHENICLLNSYF
jgi:hypothetical protein